MAKWLRQRCLRDMKLRLLHRTGLLTEAQVRGSKALLPLSKGTSVNNPVL